MRIWLLWLALLLTTPPVAASPITGHSAPRRIVSLTPAITEMLFALGLGSRVVGDTTYCDYPPAARRVAKIGDVRVNYERVVALRPDLVVGDEVATPSAIIRLSQLRLPVFGVRPDTLDGVEQSIRRLGQVTGAVPQANMLVAHMEATRRMARALAALDPRHPSVLIVIGTNPLFMAGRRTFLDSIVSEAGGVNAVNLGGYGALSKELAMAHPPDVILAAPGDQAALRADPALSRLPAVRARRFVYVTDRNLIERPGPRVMDGLLQVARGLHPGGR
jgi:iron complex transport system substrate-binding protein